MEILLVEDNAADVEIAQESFLECEVPNRVSVVYNGEDAVKFLRHEEPFQSSVPPDIILLDLNLPKKNGHEVLAEIKQDPKLCSIPVIVLTSSRAEEDISKSYELHANCYLTKPGDFDKFISLTKTVVEFWFERVILPKGK
jgi:CheY-like chemotaxis protein